MSARAIVCRVLGKQLFDLTNTTALLTCQQQRLKCVLVKPRDPGDKSVNLRRIVHFKDEYTVEPLKVSNLAGRDRETGRVVIGTLGGGIKHKYRWIDWYRTGPTDLDEKPKEEVVLDIIVDKNRTAHVALVGCGKQLKYYLATENMKPGMIIRTHCGIPKYPIRPKEGDAYPLGALPVATKINCIERFPGQGGAFIHAAGSAASIKGSTADGKIIVELPTKHTLGLDPHCMATVGRLSNIGHGDEHIGSAPNLRHLGHRPRSGLYQKKDGRFGRKIRRPPSLNIPRMKLETTTKLQLTITALENKKRRSQRFDW